MNKVILIGNVTADAELRVLSNGGNVANLRLATNDRWTDKEGVKHDDTEYHTLVVYGKLADIAGKYCPKGKQIMVEGALVTRKWTDKNGVDRYTTEIKVSNLELLGGAGATPRAVTSPATAPFAPTPAATPRKIAPAIVSTASADGFDNDIPF